VLSRYGLEVCSSDQTGAEDGVFVRPVGNAEVLRVASVHPAGDRLLSVGGLPVTAGSSLGDALAEVEQRKQREVAQMGLRGGGFDCSWLPVTFVLARQVARETAEGVSAAEVVAARYEAGAVRAWELLTASFAARLQQTQAAVAACRKRLMAAFI
jgi:hypothetical protein